MMTAAFVVVVLGVLAFSTLFSIYYGWALSILWGWFIVPMGVPPISVAHAIGIGLIVGMFKGAKAKTKGEEEWYEALATVAAIPVVSLGIGYIVKLFMGQ